MRFLQVDPVSIAHEACIDALSGLADASRELASSEWHSVLSAMYHDARPCTEGNNIEPWNCRLGRGGRRMCGRCVELGR